MLEASTAAQMNGIYLRGSFSATANEHTKYSSNRQTPWPFMNFLLLTVAGGYHVIQSYISISALCEWLASIGHAVIICFI